MSVIAITIAAVIIAIILGAAGGYMARKKSAEAQIGSAEDEARRILDEAREKSNAEKKEAILEAKEEIHRMRQELDRDTKERRNELSRQERRMVQKEENLDKKLDSLEKKEVLLSKKEARLNESQAQLDAMQEKEDAELARIAELSRDEARNILMDEVEESLKHDKALRDANQGRGGQKGARHFEHGDSTLRGRPRDGDDGFCRGTAQRRHERSNHRARRQKHSHTGNFDGH